MGQISFCVLCVAVLRICGFSLGAKPSNASKGMFANFDIEAARSLKLSEVGRNLGDSLGTAMAKNFSNFGANATKNLNFDNFEANAAKNLNFDNFGANAAKNLNFDNFAVDASKFVSVSVMMSVMMSVSGNLMIQALPHLPPKTIPVVVVSFVFSVCSGAFFTLRHLFK
eukprot:CAMPEP_0197346178 /NCGR_PEP_ID=MMETSP0893-20130614/5357_1 /TAXON_ID=44058 ORGANISM="Aureoumbra lagunensis, Strain CCMP1510" /NCGR_SAMPLE_ID=MMETSP0893 /ASSEMBLY_ACC=CAM_ASM_000539 /LENGTH=168 /DNA_ID=CAMNT_0042854861 /DNA_START=29 /DNA_END=535 /DNA_ORIENTATION=+